MNLNTIKDKGHLFFQFLLGKLELKNAIRLGIAATLSFYIGLKFAKWTERPDVLANGLWCVVATVVVLQASLGGTYKAILNRLSGVCIGSILGALFATVLGTWELSLGLAMAATILVCSFFNLKESYRIASLSVAAVMIPWGLHPLISPWTFAFFRSVDTLMGLTVAVLIAYVIWPSQAVNKVHQNMDKILNLLEQLYQETLLSSDRKENQEDKVLGLINEIDDLFVQSRLMLDEAKMEVFIHSTNLPIWRELLNSLENLFYAINNLPSVFTSHLQTMFDAEMKREVDDLMKRVDEAFHILVKRVKDPHLPVSLQVISTAESKLDAQMIRFRETYRTRKFDLKDVEKYFVFFYNLKLMINELIQFNQLLDLTYVDSVRD